MPSGDPTPPCLLPCGCCCCLWGCRSCRRCSSRSLPSCSCPTRALPHWLMSPASCPVGVGWEVPPPAVHMLAGTSPTGGGGMQMERGLGASGGHERACMGQGRQQYISEGMGTSELGLSRASCGQWRCRWRRCSGPYCGSPFPVCEVYSTGTKNGSAMHCQVSGAPGAALEKVCGLPPFARELIAVPDSL